VQKEKLFPLLILVLGLALFWPLFEIGYSANLGSLEPAVLTLGRRVAQEGIFGWYPNWYLGLPFRFAGPPLSWWLLGYLEKLHIADILTAYRLLAFASLVSFPISFYFLASKIFKNYKIAFLGTLLLLLMPSIGYLFPKYLDIGREFGFAPSWQLGWQIPRSVGLALLPLALIVFWRLFEKISYVRFIQAVFAASLLFILDGVTSLSFLIGVAALLIFEGHRGEAAQKVFVGVFALLGAFLVDFFWYSLQNIKIIAFSPSIAGIGLIEFIKLLMQSALGIGPALLVIFKFKLFDKKRRELALILLWLLPFIVITLLFYFSNPDFLSEYTRFLPEIEIGIALVVTYIVQQMLTGKADRKLMHLVSQILLIIILIYSMFYLPGRFAIFKTHPNIKNTAEYQIADWLFKNASPGRIYFSGSTAFWFNEFVPDLWQVRGGIDQAAINQIWQDASYQIRTNSDLNKSILWLRALRVDYLVVHDKNSREFYHDFEYPYKFDDCRNLCELVFDSRQGDKIYRINSRIAAVGDFGDYKSLKKVQKGDNLDALASYVYWLEKGESVDFGYQKNKITVNLNLKAQKLISLGINYHPGWKASDNYGNRLKVSKDPMGQMAIFPKAEGEQNITVIYKDGLDLYLGIFISLGTFVFLLTILPNKFEKLMQKVASYWQDPEEN